MWLRLLSWSAPVVCALLLTVPGRSEDTAPPDKPATKSRKFLFTYAAAVTGLEPGKKARVWLPVPPTTEDQDVRIVSKEAPAEAKIDTEPKTGNRMLYLEAKADAEGKVPLKVVYEVTRRELKGESSRELEEDMDALARFLKADAMVPVEGEPLEKIKNKLIKDRELPKDETAAARVFYDAVNGHMRYSKEGKEGKDWGRGDSVWACDSGFGNCSDFHSLFISLARSRKIPAKFEIGFPLPEKRGEGEVAGYHCWAKFRPAGKGWVPVDISEANKNPQMKDYYFGNLTENRVMFSTGRDLGLVPRQDDKPLKFFVYPYAEVDGKEYPPEKIQKKFSFKDQ
jgi:transglutaminase-like putative cysteine protease